MVDKKATTEIQDDIKAMVSQDVDVLVILNQGSFQSRP